MIHEVWLLVPIGILVIVGMMLIRALKDLKKQTDTTQEPSTFDGIDAGEFKRDETP